MVVMVLGGILFVGVAAWVAQKHDVLHRLMLDIYGTRGMATAEPLGAGEYRLRLALESEIYARGYSGVLSGGDPTSNAEFSVPVVYDPADPIRFLPAGQSYASAVVAGLLFLLGMICVLLARRALYAAERMRRLSQQRAELERSRRKHHQKHRHGHHHAGH